MWQFCWAHGNVFFLVASHICGYINIIYVWWTTLHCHIGWHWEVGITLGNDIVRPDLGPYREKLCLRPFIIWLLVWMVITSEVCLHEDQLKSTGAKKKMSNVLHEECDAKILLGVNVLNSSCLPTCHHIMSRIGQNGNYFEMAKKNQQNKNIWACSYLAETVESFQMSWYHISQSGPYLTETSFFLICIIILNW